MATHPGRSAPGSSGAPLPENAAQARARLRAEVARRLGPFPEDDPPAPVADALLVVSELVSNAIRHGGGLSVFDVVAYGSILAISVGDRSPAPLPVPRAEFSPGRVGGYGLPIVATLSEELTVTETPDGGGKILTVVLPLTSG
ncbi:ATP-binding protein (plasmid) [Streptomyces sp. BI20]|uniref:ATP-binding protein n=1 Tax=Streptomyces sp. BI20 TaxID=3403460 RepID=UPI003C78CC99